MPLRRPTTLEPPAGGGGAVFSGSVRRSRENEGGLDVGQEQRGS